jgi:hypothetical protein
MTPAVDPEAETGETRVVAGRYEVRRALGSGGMGVVYEAENTWTRRRVALKVLPPDRATDPMVVERFMREARTTASLRHPNVVDVLDMGQDPADGSLFIVQELLRGEDLRAFLEREGPVDERRARELIVPALRGLAAAHAAGIVHRDIKPANLFLARGPEGETVIKVIDFGIAREAAGDARHRTETGVTIGTPAYMAPEQLRAQKDVGPAADVWSVGVVLHELLTGDTPYPSDNYNVLVHRVLSGDPPPLDETLRDAPTLRPIVARCLAHDAAARYPDAAALLAALREEPITPKPEAAPPAPAATTARGGTPRRPWPIAAAVVAVVLTSLAVAVTATRTPTPTPTPVAVLRAPATRDAAVMATPDVATAVVTAPEPAADASVDAPPADPPRVAGGHGRRGHRGQPPTVAAPVAEVPRAPTNPLAHGGDYP